MASIWEYQESFEAGQINFFAFLGPVCPLCHRPDCYQAITPYRRYAIELFPEFRKERIPIARFLCCRTGQTFSLLPIQLIPYVQYTVQAVIGALLLGLVVRPKGQQGFHGAALAVDPESLVTPWLVACWLVLVWKGFQRAHAVLRRWYDLSHIRTPERSALWEQTLGYFLSLGWNPEIRWGPWLQDLVHRFSQTTKQFFWGVPSQLRAVRRP